MTTLEEVFLKANGDIEDTKLTKKDRGSTLNGSSEEVK